ncbi:MAG: diacylglycerol kinase family lipid kinase [Anaerolineae bacterium]|nr:diacylglycerol kinase family lipid kinase [Anaerolineae bacterium]
MKVKVILNPYANRWGAQARLPEVESALKAAHLDYDLALTTGAKDGTELAKTAVAEGYDAVIAAGGDGTISEVANGLITAVPENEPTIPLGILPVGSANDLAKMMGLPQTLPAAANLIASGHTRLLDAGCVQYDGKIHYFDNNSAIAMEPMITLEHEKIQRVSGEARYYLAILKGVIKLKAWQMSITWDDGEYVGPTYLLSVCNGPRTGGMMIAPGAVMDDGYFDFVLAPEVPKTTVVNFLLKLTKGTHVEHPITTFKRTKSLTITSEPGTPLHADGEILSESAKEIVYTILPQKLTMLVPPQ